VAIHLILTSAACHVPTCLVNAAIGAIPAEDLDLHPILTAELLAPALLDLDARGASPTTQDVFQDLPLNVVRNLNLRLFDFSCMLFSHVLAFYKTKRC
jgi:hypothetical protein